MTPSTSDAAPPRRPGLRRFVGLWRYARQAFELVWETDGRLTVGLLGLTVACGVLPAGIPYVGKLIIDGVVRTAGAHSWEQRRAVLALVGIELSLVAALIGLQRSLAVCDALLRVRLAQRVIELILNKALTLTLLDLENAELHDQLRQVREHATERPLSLVRRALLGLQLTVALVGFLTLLAAYSPWIMALLLAAALPAVLVEARFNADAFRLFRAHSPEARRQAYLETVLSREDHFKEVALLGLGPVLLGRHRRIFQKWYGEDRALTVRRGAWGFALALVASVALAGSYAWVAWQAMAGTVSVGALSMLFAVLRQTQSSATELLLVVAGMYDDNQYMSTLHEFLEYSVSTPKGSCSSGPLSNDGLRFEDVEFRYPGSAAPAICDINVQLAPGAKLAIVGRNGAGKTTFVKLALGLYAPTRGRVLLDGRDLREWDGNALAARFAVLFQDFVRYQFLAGENIGIGDVDHLEDGAAWVRAARRALVHDLISELPSGYNTQLGHWFDTGHELSLGEWQKVGLARLFMRERADILVLDEPSASLDAESEAQILEHLRQHAERRSVVMISHRLSTLRAADQILVLDHGRCIERGSHDQLLALNGAYAELFRAQATGYA